MKWNEIYFRYLYETQDCLDKLYYDYLGLRQGDEVKDLRIIGIGDMDQTYVGADPKPYELEVVKIIESLLNKDSRRNSYESSESGSSEGRDTKIDKDTTVDRDDRIPSMSLFISHG